MTPSQQRIMELFKCSEEEADEILKAPVGSEWWKKIREYPPSVYMNDMFPVDWAIKDGRYHAHQTRRMRWDLPYSTPGINDRLMKLLDPTPEELERRAKKLEDFKMIYGGGSVHIPLDFELKIEHQSLQLGLGGWFSERDREGDCFIKPDKDEDTGEDKDE